METPVEVRGRGFCQPPQPPVLVVREAGHQTPAAAWSWRSANKARAKLGTAVWAESVGPAWKGCDCSHRYRVLAAESSSILGLDPGLSHNQRNTEMFPALTRPQKETSRRSLSTHESQSSFIIHFPPCQPLWSLKIFLQASQPWGRIHHFLCSTDRTPVLQGGKSPKATVLVRGSTAPEAPLLLQERLLPHQCGNFLGAHTQTCLAPNSPAMIPRQAGLAASTL